MLSQVLFTPCGLGQSTDSRARDLPTASFTLLHIICPASMVGRYHARSVGADLGYHVMPGSCMRKVRCYWQLLFLGPSHRAASICIDTLNVFPGALGMSLKRNTHSFVVGKYEHEQLVGLLSRLLH
jgi:hypothetical protein